MPDQVRHDGIGMRSRVGARDDGGEEMPDQVRHDGKELFFGFLAAEGGDVGGVVDAEVGGWFDGGGVGLAEFEVVFFEGVAEAAPYWDVVFVVFASVPEFLAEAGVGFEAGIVENQIHSKVLVGTFVVDGVVPEGEFEIGGEGCRGKPGMTER